jgi:serine-type D-Ala-D-Ala carboxypeptidase (penicillin-binding protein 5/6)
VRQDGRVRRRRLIALVALATLFFLAPSPGLALAGQMPPPTMVPVPGGGTTPSPFPQALRTPPPSNEPPTVAAGAVVLADLDTGQILWGNEIEERRPIASITKIMTALIVIQRTDPSDVVTVSPAAAAPAPSAAAAELGLVPGERISIQDLLYALLLQSANDAAVALAEHVAGSVDAFVDVMNAEARRLHLADTRFASPNGLDDSGYSTARDLAVLTRAAFDSPLFASIVRTKFHRIPSPSGRPRMIQNRNVLLWLYPGAIGVKTGFTTPAGFCVVAAATRDGLRLVAVILGEPGEPFSDAAAVLDYGFGSFERREVVAGGQGFGSIAIGERDVPVSAARGLTVLVPVGARVRRVVTTLPDVAFPPAMGDRVGYVKVSAPNLPLGRVPLVVSALPDPPPAEPGPWWRRAASAVVQSVSGVLSSLFG